MIQLEEKKFYTLLRFFFSDFFCEGLEKAVADEEEEVSVVTLFRGMEFFFDLVKEQGIEFPYESIEEYVVKTYRDGKEMYEKLKERYGREIKEYHGREKSFEEIYGNSFFL
ncbi:MAG: hypothetical protein IKT67_09905 [Lachnospiraceae bacterium]|nr:hypothetical protein [Lachnospiraceae bacterium]